MNPVRVSPALVLRPEARGRFVLICDHASNRVPAEFDNLGLSAAELAGHIAWDIGAGGLTAGLAELLDAPAVLCGSSRLVIDCNRQLDSPALIPLRSDGIEIPGNAGLSEASRAARIERWFQPYHDAIENLLDERSERGQESILISVHSMAAALQEQPRPWQIALSSFTDRRLTDPVLAALRAASDLQVGDNEPYSVEPDVDYSIPFHAMRRGLRHLQVEFRQDEIADAVGQQHWAARFAAVLAACA